ncbi:MAG: RcpC/CpaB family pilus assembly protein [Acidimicrobiia bacterium]|nr:RcpC/CpaB family pilus assembly protein [Acidimicrobiia bacterium]
MNKKVLGIIVAIALAGFGTFALAAYVEGAEDRALEGEELVQVYVVEDLIPAGMPAEDIVDRVAQERVPAKIVPDGVISDLDVLEELIASVDLLPGEQLVRGRFSTPAVFDREQARAIDVPPGLQEVTLSLDPHRAVGGNILPGDSVGVFLSFDPFDLEGVVDIDNAEETTFSDLAIQSSQTDDGSGETTEDDAETTAQKTPNTTSLTLHKVLVTNVQLERLPETIEEESSEGINSETTLAPTGNLLVTVALDTADAERLVFGAEFGHVWLSSESEEARELGGRIQTRATVYLDLSRVN